MLGTAVRKRNHRTVAKQDDARPRGGGESFVDHLSLGISQGLAQAVAGTEGSVERPEESFGVVVSQRPLAAQYSGRAGGQKGTRKTQNTFPFEACAARASTGRQHHDAPPAGPAR